jgi:hypothetical protein
MVNPVNAGDFFESAPKQIAVPFTVALDPDSQESYLDPKKVKHFDLPEGIRVQRVAKGAPYPIDQGFGLTVVGQGTAECDGYLIQEKLFPQFLSKAAYAAIFGDQKPVEGQILIAGNPIGCVVLEQDVTFEFLDETFPATTGMVLYENPSDPDGYTVLSALDFFQDHLILLG